MAPRLRDDLAGLVPYDPDMRDVEVMLSANENSFGLPGEVSAEMARRLAEVPANRYPDATCRRLRALLGEMWGVPARNVVVGNGGDELIFDLLLGFGGSGRVLVNCPPTFSAYELYAQLTGTPVVNVPRTPAYDVDQDAVLSALSALAALAGEAPADAAQSGAQGTAAKKTVGLVVLTSPNNPTGNLVDPEFVRKVAALAPDAVILVDEAYGEFAPEGSSCVSLLAELPNLCVLRTLSKAYSLAGARTGYVVCGDSVADGILAVRQPYSVSRFDQAAAETVVQMRDQIAPITAALVEGRGWLAGQLEALALKACERYGADALQVYPSAANFIAIRLRSDLYPELPSAPQVHEALAREHSILVRNFSSTPGLFGTLRITVGTPAQHERLMAALYQVLGL